MAQAFALSVAEFLQSYPSHPALRNLTQPKKGPATKVPASPPETPHRQEAPEASKETPAESKDPRPVAAKYERQMWFYLVRQDKGKRGMSSRWMPQHHFTVDELSAPEMQDLRADHLSTLSPERMAQVAALRALSEPW